MHESPFRSFPAHRPTEREVVFQLPDQEPVSAIDARLIDLVRTVAERGRRRATVTPVGRIG